MRREPAKAPDESDTDAASPLVVVPFVLDGADHLLIGLPAGGSPRNPLAMLSEAERAVVCAAVAGQSNRQIADARGVSARTIANQLASAFRKLGVTSRAGLASLLAR